MLQEIEGIGTEATRASIIETIKKHGYISIQKNSVFLTDKGRVLCEALTGSLLASPTMTAKWETYLKKISTGTGSSAHFLESMERFLHHLINQVPSTIETLNFSVSHLPETKKRNRWSTEPVVTCPTCKNGTIIARAKFYGCDAYKEGCKQTFPLYLLKKKLSPAQIKTLCTTGRTNQLKGFVSKDGKKFNAALQLKDGKIELLFS